MSRTSSSLRRFCIATAFFGIALGATSTSAQAFCIPDEPQNWEDTDEEGECDFEQVFPPVVCVASHNTVKKCTGFDP